MVIPFVFGKFKLHHPYGPYGPYDPYQHYRVSLSEGRPPGEYVLKYTIHDLPSGISFDIIKDKKDLILGQLEACERLLEYVVDEEDKKTVESEITELKMVCMPILLHTPFSNY